MSTESTSSEPMSQEPLSDRTASRSSSLASGDPGDAQVVDQVQVVQMREGTLTVLDHQFRVQRPGSHRVFELPADQIRRIQLDVEVGRPPIMAIVPTSPSVEAQLLTVERDQF